MTRPSTRTAVEPPDDADRIGWVICRFANGSCLCEKAGRQACDSLHPPIQMILSIIVGERPRDGR